MDSWCRLTFTVPPASREALIVCLHELGCLGAESSDGGLTAWFAADIDELSLLETLRREMGPGSEGMRLEGSEPVADGFWHERWMETLEPIAVGGSFLVVPGPVTPPGVSHRRIIRLTPGRAFGTGEHATTRMCLVLLESALREGDGVLDAGTGSGILAIASRLLGAGRVVAIDIDETALTVAARNAAINDVHGIEFVAGSPDALRAEPFDLVVANINGTSLLRLMGGLAARAGRGMILSGILGEEASGVVAAAAKRGLTVARRLEEGDWTALWLVRSPRD